MRAGRGLRNEDFPEAIAAHAHGMAPAVPEIEVTDDADAPCVGGEDRKADAGYAFEHHRMRAELVVELKMRAFTEQKQIEIRQHRREAIRVLHLDYPIAEARAHSIALRSVGRAAGKQAGVVNAAQTAFMPRLINYLHVLGV